MKLDYVVWLLVEVYLERIPRDRRDPSIENEIWFLEEFRRELFPIGFPSYHRAYERLNRDI